MYYMKRLWYLADIEISFIQGGYDLALFSTFINAHLVAYLIWHGYINRQSRHKE